MMTAALPSAVAAAVILFSACSLHEADAGNVAQREFTHKACVDCPVMRVPAPGNFVPPKP
jgi:hypothetical protein